MPGCLGDCVPRPAAYNKHDIHVPMELQMSFQVSQLCQLVHLIAGAVRWCHTY